MLVDFFTKLLHGALFRCFKHVLMGLAHISTLRTLPSLSSTLKERVEDTENVNVSDNNKQEGENSTKGTT
jgi:hypothetical protein